jgi:radical SAM protein with 4Fe4S-binding SPASM domain
MCAYKETHISGPHNSMPLKLFSKIIDEFSDMKVLKSIALSLQCESLLDKDLCLKIEYIKKKNPNIKCGITTNALLLTKEKLDALCACGLDILVISLNAVREETYAAVYGVDGYEKFLQNITYVIEHKPKNLSFNFNVMLIKLNFNELFFKRHAIFDLIKQAEITLGMGTISNQCGSLSNYEQQRIIIPQLQSSTKKLYCHDIFGAVYVLFNGDVIGCCSDFRKKYVLGNLDKQNFIDIWHSSKNKKRREHMLYGNLYEVEPCSECSQAWNIMRNRSIKNSS